MIPLPELEVLVLGLAWWPLEPEDVGAGSENAGGRDPAIRYCSVAVKIMGSAHSFSVANWGRRSLAGRKLLELHKLDHGAADLVAVQIHHGQLHPGLLGCTGLSVARRGGSGDRYAGQPHHRLDAGLGQFLERLIKIPYQKRHVLESLSSFPEELRVYGLPFEYLYQLNED